MLTTPSGRKRLRWEDNPIPTIFSFPPSVSAPVQSRRKCPTDRNIQADEMEMFLQRDKINSLADFTEDDKPDGWILEKFSDYVRVYQLTPGMPEVLGAIVINSFFQVKLSYKGRQISLPAWLRSQPGCRLKRRSQLLELCNYVKNVDDDSNDFPLLSTLARLVYVRGKVPYPAIVMRFALYLRYTSLASYRILCEHFPLPSLRALRRVTSGDLDWMAPFSSMRCTCNQNYDTMELQWSEHQQTKTYTVVWCVLC